MVLSSVKGKSKKYLGEWDSDFSQKFIMKEKISTTKHTIVWFKYEDFIMRDSC